MKKITILFIGIIGTLISIHAQNDNNQFPCTKTVVESMDSLLTYINKTPVTSHILYDRVLAFAGLQDFNREERTDTSNYTHFIQSWSELYRASYKQDFLPVDSLKYKVKRNKQPGIVDIGIINTPFHVIDFGTNKANAKLKFDKGRFYNKPGKNPFIQKQAFVIAPLSKTAKGSTITFRFGKQFWLHKNGKPIKTLKADFGNGVWHTVVNNTRITEPEVSVTYESSGDKTIAFQITFPDGSTKTTYGELYVNAVPLTKALVSDPLIENGTIWADIAFKDYAETTAIKGRNDYRIFYHTNNGNTSKTLLKPIIILDGFDPEDTRKIESGDFGHTSPESIFEIMEYEDNYGVGQNLVVKLREQGYDVVIVNFPGYTTQGKEIDGGADYIERNAMSVIALINSLNQKLQQNGSSENLVIVGPSMGGLVSRYALAYMEKHNMNHNCRLWVSFDAPHLGANIPIAAQQTLYFFGYTGGQEVAKDKYNNSLRSPAARQMLIEQMDGLNNNTTFRQNFLTNLTNNGISGSNGWPQNLRKVALINGSITGKKNHTERQQFLKMTGTMTFLDIKVAEIICNFLPAPLNTARTFKGRVTLTGFLYIDFIDGTYNTTNLNPRGSMDVVPGGYYDTQGIIKDGFSEGLDDAGVSDSWTILHNHSFIPTISSLALKNADFNWNNRIEKNLVCTGETPFDSYFAPDENEDHIYLTNANVNWISKEINGIDQLPTIRPPANSLSGPNLACYGLSYNYSFAPCIITNENVNWSTSSNLEIINSSNASITVKSKTASTNGPGKVQAVIPGAGYVTTVRKDFWVGKPKNPTNITFYPSNPCLNQIVIALVSANNPTISGVHYEWRNTHTYMDQNSSASEVHFTTLPSFPYTTNVYVKGTNPCGSSLEYSELLSVKDCGGGGIIPVPYSVEEPVLLVSPNPANDYIEAEIDVDNFEAGNNNKIHIKLFNNMSIPVYTGNSDQKTFRINTSNLQYGLYLLQVIYKGEKYSKQVLIEH